MSTKKILVLGGGYGGILTAKHLSNKLKKHNDIEIKLIDKRPYHTMLTELHEVAACRVPEEAIKLDLKKILEGRKAEFVLDEIKNVDFENNKLLGVDGNTYDYDYLVIGSGSKPTFFGTKGAEENAFTLWSYEDAVRIKHHILDTVEKATQERNPEKRKAMLTFVVIGSGFTGIEMVGELAEFKPRLCKKFSLSPEEIRICVVDMVPRILGNFKEKMIVKTENRLKKMGVEVWTSSPVKEVNSTYVMAGDNKIETYTAIWAAGIESSDLCAELSCEKAARNRLVTDEFLRLKDYKNVYVVGDNILYTPEGEERPVPQMVENAEHSSSLVAKNIYSAITGAEQKPYKPVFHGAMVCIGGGYGVAQVGTPKTQFVFSGLIAMFIKHFINVIYFLQVAGFNKIYTYLQHEIFYVPDRRSFLGGHFSNASPNFWLVPLRLFVGGKWLLEGYEKIQKVIENPNNIFLIPAKVVDGVSAASEATASYGEALPVPEFISNMVEWSMNLMFYTPDGKFTQLAKYFQIAMVSGEIIVGLCLLGGLFTALASIMSVGMGIMIWVSGMAPVEMLWYMMAGIALIGGSGSQFGLDYYVLPILNKYWKKSKWVKKNYLYVD